MTTKWHEAKILHIARNADFMVPIHTIADRDLRKKTRRMVADGKLVLVYRSSANFFYRTPK